MKNKPWIIALCLLMLSNTTYAQDNDVRPLMWNLFEALSYLLPLSLQEKDLDDNDQRLLQEQLAGTLTDLRLQVRTAVLVHLVVRRRHALVRLRRLQPGLLLERTIPGVHRGVVGPGGRRRHGCRLRGRRSRGDTVQAS